MKSYGFLVLTLVLFLAMPLWQSALAAVTMSVADYTVTPVIDVDGEGNFFDQDEIVLAVDFTRAATDTIVSFDVSMTFPADKLQVSRWSTLRAETNSWSTTMNYNNSAGTLNFAAADSVGITGATPTAGVVVYIVFDCSNMYPGDIPRLDLTLKHGSTTAADDTASISMTYTYGNLTADQAVSALDAAFTLKHVVGDINLDSFGKWGEAFVEVSGDGQVTAYDGSLILQKVAGSLTAFPIETADRPAPTLLGTGAKTITLSKPKEDLSAIDSLVLSSILSIDSLKGVYGAEFFIKTNNSDIRILDVSVLPEFKDAQERGMLWEHGFLDGEKVIALARVDPGEFSGDLFEIKFTAPLGEDLYNPLSLVRAKINQGASQIKINTIPFNWKASIDGNRLYANYPNPFNPETWIPYRLATNQEVKIVIYDSFGQVVRDLGLGVKSAGYYVDKPRAAYWDGLSQLGERVASGVYFYTMRAGDFTSTRKMLVVK